jgi:hypothetical protein
LAFEEARTNAALKRHAVRLGLDTSHLPGSIDRRPVRTRRFTDEDLCVAVAESITLAEVMRRLGYEPSGWMHRYIKVQIGRLDLDTSHFVGQGWARGKPTRTPSNLDHLRSGSSKARRSAGAT